MSQNQPINTSSHNNNNNNNNNHILINNETKLIKIEEKGQDKITNCSEKIIENQYTNGDYNNRIILTTISDKVNENEQPAIIIDCAVETNKPIDSLNVIKQSSLVITDTKSQSKDSLSKKPLNLEIEPKINNTPIEVKLTNKIRSKIAKLTTKSSSINKSSKTVAGKMNNKNSADKNKNVNKINNINLIVSSQNNLKTEIQLNEANKILDNTSVPTNRSVDNNNAVLVNEKVLIKSSEQINKNDYSEKLSSTAVVEICERIILGNEHTDQMVDGADAVKLPASCSVKFGKSKHFLFFIKLNNLQIFFYKIEYFQFN